MTLNVNFPALFALWANVLHWGVCHSPSRQSVPSSLRFLPSSVLGGALNSACPRSFQGTSCSTSLTAPRVATLQLNMGVSWLSASEQMLVLLLAVSLGLLGRRKTSVTRQSIQSRRQGRVLHSDLSAMCQLVS